MYLLVVAQEYMPSTVRVATSSGAIPRPTPGRVGGGLGRVPPHVDGLRCTNHAGLTVPRHALCLALEVENDLLCVDVSRLDPLEHPDGDRHLLSKALVQQRAALLSQLAPRVQRYIILVLVRNKLCILDPPGHRPTGRQEVVVFREHNLSRKASVLKSSRVGCFRRLLERQGSLPRPVGTRKRAAAFEKAAEESNVALKQVDYRVKIELAANADFVARGGMRLQGMEDAERYAHQHKAQAARDARASSKLAQEARRVAGECHEVVGISARMLKGVQAAHADAQQVVLRLEGKAQGLSRHRETRVVDKYWAVQVSGCSAEAAASSSGGGAGDSAVAGAAPCGGGGGGGVSSDGSRPAPRSPAPTPPPAVAALEAPLAPGTAPSPP